AEGGDVSSGGGRRGPAAGHWREGGRRGGGRRADEQELPASAYGGERCLEGARGAGCLDDRIGAVTARELTHRPGWIRSPGGDCLCRAECPCRLRAPFADGDREDRPGP